MSYWLWCVCVPKRLVTNPVPLIRRIAALAADDDDDGNRKCFQLL